jgi:hypothetical protein
MAVKALLSRRALIQLFIVFHLGVMVVGSLYEAKDNALAFELYRPYFRWLRLGHRWRLFAPEARRFTHYYRATIEYPDGSVQQWLPPHSPKWGFFERHLGYAFQRWSHSSHQLEGRGGADGDGALWTDLAHFLTRVYDEPSRHPMRVRFYMSKAWWPEPTAERPVAPPLTELKWVETLYFTYDPKAGRYH